LIDSIKSVKEIIEEIISDAEGIISGRLQTLLQ
jgi:hypothetical protein